LDRKSVCAVAIRRLSASLKSSMLVFASSVVALLTVLSAVDVAPLFPLSRSSWEKNLAAIVRSLILEILVCNILNCTFHIITCFDDITVDVLYQQMFVRIIFIVCYQLMLLLVKL